MLQIETNNASQLLQSIHSAITTGVIKTWELDHDGDFIHTPPQWAKRGWLRPSIPSQSRMNLAYVLVSAQSGPLGDPEASAVLHGRFIEMLLTHFPTKFTLATAKPD